MEANASTADIGAAITCAACGGSQFVLLNGQEELQCVRCGSGKFIATGTAPVRFVPSTCDFIFVPGDR